MSADYGILKLDDDVQVIDGNRLELKSLRKLLSRKDYIGSGVSVERTAIDLDRAWHEIARNSVESSDPLN